MKIDNKQGIRELYKNLTRQVQGPDAQFKDSVTGADQSQSARVTPATTTKTESVAENYDQVLMQTDERAIQFAARAVAEAPDIREARVNQIAEQIRNGTYKVDPEAVAEQLLASGVLRSDD